MSETPQDKSDAAVPPIDLPQEDLVEQLAEQSAEEIEEQLAEESLTDTREAELVDLQLPSDEEMDAICEQAKAMEDTSPDARCAELLSKGLLKDLAPLFNPETRRESPGRDNSVSAKVVPDMAATLECFTRIAAAVGYNPPAPNQRRYAGPELRLRYCRIDACDVAMTTVSWPINLTGCKFMGAAMFMGSTFSAKTLIEHAVFEGGADFGLAKFQLDASFRGSAFTASTSVSATFAGVTFCRHANFDLTRFAAAVQFDYGTFEGQVRFFRAQFKGAAGFNETKFQDQARFEFTAFRSRADFSSCEFQGAAPDFHKAAFESEVVFAGVDLEQYLDLRGADFEPGASLNVADIRIRSSNVLGGNVRLSSSQLRKWQWWPLGFNSLIAADNPRDIKLDARRQLKSELEQDGADAADARARYKKALAGQRESLASACTQYGVLEENFRAQGDPDSRYSEDFCHYRFHDLWRMTHRHKFNPLCWSNWFFMKICFGYGVYPLRVLIAGIMLIVFFSLFYSTGGFVMADGALDLETSRTIIDAATGAQTSEAVRLSALPGWERWTTALYFSTTTFTTVGYGDWRPIGRASFAAACEGLLGVFIMSVFTVVFARKFVR